jgi:hypothetical protein
MKATLTFNLEDAEDKFNFKRCEKAKDMAMLLWELQVNSYRKFTKYNKNQNGEYQQGIEEVFQYIRDLYDEYEIDAEKLVY